MLKPINKIQTPTNFKFLPSENILQSYMKTHNISKFLILFVLFSFFKLNAQTFLGLQQSNMSGIHQASLNPANIAGARHRLYINGLTFNTGFNNNYLSLNLPFSALDIIRGKVPNKYKNASGGVAFQESWLKENLNGKPKNFNLYLQTRTPGVLFKVSKGLSLGLTYKNTFSIQVNDVAEPLARLARYGVDSSNGTVAFSGPNSFNVGQTFGDNAFSININAFGELGGTVAKTLLDNKLMVIKVGVTPKLLLGYATGFVKNNGIVIKAPGSDTIIFGKTDVFYGYTDPSLFQNIGTSSINLDFLRNKIQGVGFGYDLGATFEYKPQTTKLLISKKNNYLFRVGISLLDAGNIKYNNIQTTHIRNISGDKVFKLDSAFARAWSQGQEQGIKYSDSVARTIFAIDTTTQSIFSKMPTTLNLQFDYNVFKWFYVGANISQDFRGKRSIGMRKPSYATIIPRFESKIFEFSIPMGLMNDYKTGRMGFFARVGPVFIGSDNIIGQLKSSNFYGADFYFGISTGIPSKKAKKKPESNG